MPDMDKFSEEEAILLVSLPLRVGKWMSEADDEEGGHDDEQEDEALNEILSQFARMQIGTAFTGEIAKQVMENKDLWPGWSDQIFTVIRDGENAVRLIESKLGKSKAKNYRLMLLKIARHVAKAADEFDDFSPEEEKTSGLGGLVKKVVGKVAPKTQREQSHLANISTAEQAAIKELDEALAIEED
jgi:hypothetical protein